MEETVRGEQWLKVKEHKDNGANEQIGTRAEGYKGKETQQ